MPLMLLGLMSHLFFCFSHLLGHELSSLFCDPLHWFPLLPLTSHSSCLCWNYFLIQLVNQNFKKLTEEQTKLNRSRNTQRTATQSTSSLCQHTSSPVSSTGCHRSKESTNRIIFSSFCPLNKNNPRIILSSLWFLKCSGFSPFHQDKCTLDCHLDSG